MSLKNFVRSYGLSFLLALCPVFLLATEKSYSLHDGHHVPLDQKLIQLLNYRNGVFIEVGAHNGIEQSNTKRLEEYYDWTGILIEPSPNLFSFLKVNRPNSRCFGCALGSFKEDNTFIYGDFDGGLMSSVNGMRVNRPAKTRVMVRSLQSILDEVGIHHVDFFSLDTEGYELNILQGIDFERTTFDYMLIEIYNHQYDEIVSLLASQGYALVENFSGYTHANSPCWDGLINDYLFKRVSTK